MMMVDTIDKAKLLYHKSTLVEIMQTLIAEFASYYVVKFEVD